MSFVDEFLRALGDCAVIPGQPGHSDPHFLQVGEFEGISREEWELAEPGVFGERGPRVVAIQRIREHIFYLLAFWDSKGEFPPRGETLEEIGKVASIFDAAELYRGFLDRSSRIDEIPVARCVYHRQKQ